MLDDYAGATQTDWSMIRQATLADSDPAEAAMEALGRRYWPAVFAYVRSSGCDVHEAADLTQSFVCDVIIGRRLFHLADPSRGRFRSLLLRALKNYLIERYRSVQRKSRSGRRSISIDPQLLADAESRSTMPPDAAFNAQWSAMIVRRVLDHVRDGCERDGFTPHWTIFEYRVVRPVLHGEPPASYADLVDRLDLESTAQAANMLVTVKRRFARRLHQEIAGTIENPEEADVELRDLIGDVEAAK